jgi:hypothetical protein
LLGILSQLSKSPDGKPGLIGIIWSDQPRILFMASGCLIGIYWDGMSTSEFWKPLLGCYENWVPFFSDQLFGEYPPFLVNHDPNWSRLRMKTSNDTGVLLRNPWLFGCLKVPCRFVDAKNRYPAW